MRIPDDIIETIRTQANIVDVIGEHVHLRKAGRNYVGLCPFHKEKTPSFNVNSERGMYKCFGCGRAGNVITFVEEHLHLPFPEAVRHLATKLGIVIPTDTEDDVAGVGARKDAARKALNEAAQFYQETLTSSDGAPARAFFHKRGFTDDTINIFTLGAAPASWDALHSHLTKRGFTDEHLEDAGLIIRRDDGSIYDRFRGRAMFTIRDDVGRVVGFSARTITNDPDTPKYINSPQSIVFDKSRTVYALNLAKRSIAEHRIAVIVEGQVDVITMHQNGFSQTVATSGTSLTADQLQILKRWADTVVLIFDADQAGQKAMSRGIELALASGLDVRCVTLPSGYDPDSFLRSNNVSEMKTLIENASPWMEYQVARFRDEGIFNDAVKQADALKTVLNWISNVPDQLRKPFLIRDLSDQFRVDEQYLLRQLGHAPSRKPYQPAASSSTRDTTSKKSLDVGLLPSEKELIKIALTENHGLPLMLNQFHLDASRFISEAGKRIFERITIVEHEQNDVAQYLVNDQLLTNDERVAIADLIAMTVKPSDVWRRFEVEVPDFDVKRIVYDSILRLKEHSLTMEIHLLSQQQQLVYNFDESQRIAIQLQRLIELKHRIVLRLQANVTENVIDDDLLWLEENNNLVS